VPARECRELVLVEQVRGDARAARTARVVTDRPWLAGGARPTGLHGRELRGHRALLREHGVRELVLVGARRRRGYRGELGAQPGVQGDELARAVGRLAQLDHQALDGDEHVRTLAPRQREVGGVTGGSGGWAGRDLPTREPGTRPCVMAKPGRIVG
jgi:hypothetical protein